MKTNVTPGRYNRTISLTKFPFSGLVIIQVYKTFNFFLSVLLLTEKFMGVQRRYIFYSLSASSTEHVGVLVYL